MLKSLLKDLLPQELLRRVSNWRNRHRSTEAIFTDIYQNNRWGNDPEGGRYCSGEGTTTDQVAGYKRFLVDFIRNNPIEQIFEIGAGDFRIMRDVLKQTPDTRYVGCDVVGELIERNNRQFGNERTAFVHADAVEASLLPPADLCIIRQVLQHLSNDQIKRILAKTRQYRYVLVTEHIPVRPEEYNADKPTGGYIRLQNQRSSGVFLNMPPFSMNTQTVYECRLDDRTKTGQLVEAVLRTSLITNEENSNL